MVKTSMKSNPGLWKRVVREVKASSKGGKPNQWSARKAQIAVRRYKDLGGSYRGSKSPSNSLSKWTREDWGTKSGKNSIVGRGATGERYLPRKAREALSDSEYAATSAKKRSGMRSGRQFVSQPDSIARKTAKYRE
jgi:hypothetical protein